jgi:hypothetical protein
VWTTIFGILMWDIIFADIPYAFRHPYQVKYCVRRMLFAVCFILFFILFLFLFLFFYFYFFIFIFLFLFFYFYFLFFILFFFFFFFLSLFSSFFPFVCNNFLLKSMPLDLFSSHFIIRRKSQVCLSFLL